VFCLALPALNDFAQRLDLAALLLNRLVFSLYLRLVDARNSKSALKLGPACDDDREIFVHFRRDPHMANVGFIVACFARVPRSRSINASITRKNSLTSFPLCFLRAFTFDKLLIQVLSRNIDLIRLEALQNTPAFREYRQLLDLTVLLLYIVDLL
jgi:hypothetical protein